MAASISFASSYHWRVFQIWADGRAEVHERLLPALWFPEPFPSYAALSVSPDGRWIAGADGERAWLVALYEGADGESIPLGDIYALSPELFWEPGPSTIRWTPDSRSVALQLSMRSPTAAPDAPHRQVGLIADLDALDRPRSLQLPGSLLDRFPNGDLLLLQRLPPFGLIRFSPDRGEAALLATQGGFSDARVSPNGQEIAACSGDQLWRLGLDGQGAPVSPLRTGRLRLPRWSPDGAAIAWVSDGSGPGWRSGDAVETESGLWIEYDKFKKVNQIGELRWVDRESLLVVGDAEQSFHIVGARSGAFRHFSLLRAGRMRLRILRRHPRPRALLRPGYLRAALQRASPGASPELQRDWSQIVQLLLHDDEDHQRQAAAMLETLDDPALRAALCAAASVRDGALSILGGGSSLTAPQLRVFCEASGRDWQSDGLETAFLWAESLVDLRPLAALGPLASLTLAKAIRLERLDGLPPVEALEISKGLSLADLRSLPAGTGLRSLTLRLCGLLTAIDARLDAPGLAQLTLSQCARLRAVDLGAFPALEVLRIESCAALTQLAGLAGSSLVELSLRRCSRIRTLDPLAGAARLERLDLSGLGERLDASALSGLPALQVVDVHGCEPELTREIEAMGLRAVARASADAPWS